MDGDVDAPVDGGPDAPPDAPFSTVSPACATTPVPLIDVSPRRISNFVIAGNTVYLGVFRLEATVVDTAVLAIDATTGAEVASPLGTTGVTSVWKVGTDVYATDGNSTAGAVWKLSPGAAPVQLVTGRPRPTVATADATHVYWSELAMGGGKDVVKRRLLAGGVVEQVMVCDAARSLLLVDDELYCPAFTDGIQYGPKAGGTTSEIADPVGYPIASVVRDGDALFVVNLFNNPQLLRAPLPAGPLAVVDQLSILGRYTGLATTGEYFYTVEEDTGIRRIHRPTLDRQLIVPTLLATGDPVIHDGRLYFKSATPTSSGEPLIMYCAD